MPLTKNEISDMIKSAFPDATLELEDKYTTFSE